MRVGWGEKPVLLRSTLQINYNLGLLVSNSSLADVRRFAFTAVNTNSETTAREAQWCSDCSTNTSAA